MTRVIMPGETMVCVDIMIANDREEEGNEDFCVQLSSSDTSVNFGNEACHICVTIMDPENPGEIHINP